MTLYQFLLFVHVLAAAAWVGGAVYPLLVSELALRARDQEHSSGCSTTTNGSGRSSLSRRA